MWIYKPITTMNPKIQFAVGYFSTFGDFEAISTTATAAAAAAQVSYLNGGAKPAAETTA